MENLKNSILSGLMRVFGLLPIQKKVVISSFWGASYSDNPKFLYEAMKKNDLTINMFGFCKIRNLKLMVLE